MVAVNPAEEINKLKEIVRNRIITYCKERDNYCKAGGFYNWINSGIPLLHNNYGLPCVGGTYTYQDGAEVQINGCMYCGRQL